MTSVHYEIGDRVYAAEDILNDGVMPGAADEEELIAPAGARGGVVPRRANCRPFFAPLDHGAC